MNEAISKTKAKRNYYLLTQFLISYLLRLFQVIILDKFNIHMTPQLKYANFAVYTLIYAFQGIILGVFGPAILYLSKFTHKDQTDFSFIFFSNAIGYIIGGWSIKLLKKSMSLHNILIASILLCGISLIVSTIDFGFWNLSINMIVVGAACCTFDIVATLCIFEIFFEDNEEYWLQLVGIFFSIGGLIGPFIALQTQQLSLRAIGILILICITPLFLLKSPQLNHTSDDAQEQKQQQQNGVLELPLNAEVLICLLAFINIGFIAAYPDWIPTYAVKTGSFSKTEANLLSSIFWINQILGKAVSMCMKGTVRQKFNILLRLLLICGVITLVLQWLEQYRICCYFGTITVGLFSSPLYVFIFTIAQQHGYKLSVSATSNITLASVVAQGILVAPVGYIMGFFGFKSLIYTVFGLNLVIYSIFSYINTYLEKDSKQKRAFLQNWQ